MKFRIFDIDSPDKRLEESYLAAVKEVGVNGYVAIYKKGSPKAAANRLHKATCGCVTKRSKMDGVTNKLVADSSLAACIALEHMGVKVTTCKSCHKRKQ